MDVRSHRHHIDTSLRLPQGDDASLRLPDGEGLVRHGADDLGHPKDGDRDHQPLVSADRPLSGEESRGRQEGAGPRRPGHGPRQGGAGRSRLGGGVLVGGAAVAVDGQNRQRNGRHYNCCLLNFDQFTCLWIWPLGNCRLSD